MAFSEPHVGDVVLCRVPFATGGAVHPCVVTKVHPKSAGDVVQVDIVLSSSQISKLYLGDCVIAPYVNAEEFACSGLSRPSRFKTDTILRTLPYDSRNFLVPANKRFGDTPKIGRFTASAIARLVEGYRQLMQKQRTRCPSS